MASTNKTPNYDLSQYVGTDKPTYLGDYNSDMSKIDTAMKANDTKATTASSVAQTANDTAGTALDKATTANQNATNALNKGVQNEAQLQALQNYLNFTNIKKYDRTNIQIQGGTLNASSYLYVATNNTGSYAKIFGELSLEGNSNSVVVTITLPNSDLRPTTTRDIKNHGIVRRKLSGSVSEEVRMFNTIINPTGEIIMNFTAGIGSSNVTAYPMQFPLNLTDFTLPTE